MPLGKVVRKARNIIIGNLNRLMGKGGETSNPRMEICRGCAHCKELWKIGKICALCGCILEAKTTLEDEHCELKKW